MSADTPTAIRELMRAAAKTKAIEIDEGTIRVVRGKMNEATPTLFDIGPTFKGSTVEAQDVPRLSRQLDRVRDLMSDGKWRTLSCIALLCHGSEPSVSARLRDLRREGFTVSRERITGGLWKYRVHK